MDEFALCRIQKWTNFCLMLNTAQCYLTDPCTTIFAYKKVSLSRYTLSPSRFPINLFDLIAMSVCCLCIVRFVLFVMRLIQRPRCSWWSRLHLRICGFPRGMINIAHWVGRVFTHKGIFWYLDETQNFTLNYSIFLVLFPKPPIFPRVSSQNLLL